MADEICGSLKLMRGADGEKREGGEGKVIVSVFAVANKRKRLHFASLFIHSVRGKETENMRRALRELE